MNGLTAADYADTGQWRLIVKVRADGISAFIENTIHTDLEPQLLFSTEWEPNGDNLLRNIENAVYDHPRVLDDFSASVIVYDSKTLFMPTAVMEETEGAEETIYTSIYEADPAEVMVDVDSDLTAAHCLAGGLKGFLNRTFPGAKIESNLMNLVRKFRRNNKGVRMYVVARGAESDFVLLEDSDLLSASTHNTTGGATDVAYHAFNIIDVYGHSPLSTTIELSGEDATDELREIFCKLQHGEAISEKPQP